MGIAYVNGSGGGDLALSASSFTLTAFSVTTGNCIVVAVAGGDATAGDRAVSSITDTAGNSYSRLGNQYDNTTYTSRIEIWAAFNITGNASNVITVTFGGTCSLGLGCAAQLSGVATSSAHDTGYAPAGNADASDPYTTTAATTAAENEWVIGCFLSTGEDNTFGGSSPTVVRQTFENTMCLATRPTTSTGSYSAAVTFGGTETIMCLARAIKEYVAPTNKRRVFLFY